MPITATGSATAILDNLPTMPNALQSWHCFSSPSEMCEYVEQSRGDNWFREAFDCNTSFRGTASMDDAIALCRDGWQQGADKAADLRDRIFASAPTQRRYARYAVAGAIPNVPRYLAGNPQHMLRLESASARNRPVITLVNHMGGMATVEPCQFLNKAAATAAVVDCIESAGYSCHVIGLSMVSKEPNNVGNLVGVTVTIKEAGQALDIGRMAFAIGHVSMLRRIIFAVRGASKLNGQYLGNASGATSDFPGTVPNTFVLPSMNANARLFHNEESTMRQGVPDLVQRLRAQGCPAFRDDAIAA